MRLELMGPASPALLTELQVYWNQAHPYHPLVPWMLRERLFGPPSGDPEQMIAAREDAAGRLVGVAAGVWPCRPDKGPGIGGVRWVGTLPEWAGKGLEAALLNALCDRLARRGARTLYLLATPPHYIRPGVDTRETALIETLTGLGWRQEGVHHNMTCDLAAWRSPGVPAILGADAGGYQVRRATAADRERLRDFIERHWTVGWRDAATLGLAHDPAGVFVAERERKIVGFAAYEVDQCLGSFGPTGVAEDHRGHGLGRRLLWGCLADLQALGRPVCEIGWVGPVEFYERACGATLGPSYAFLTRALP